MTSVFSGATGSLEDIPTLPGRLPLLGHLWSMHKNLPQLFMKGRRDLGPIFFVDAGMNNRMLVVDGEEGFRLYRNRETTSEHLAEDFGDFLGDSLLTHDGDVHKRMRGAMSASFTQGGLRAAGAGEMIAKILLPRVDALIQRDNFEIVKETREAALDVIFAILGIHAKETAMWRHQYEEFSLAAINLPIMLPGFPAWRGRKGRRWLDAKLSAMVEAARKVPDGPGLLTSIVHGRDEQGRGLEGGEIVDNLRLLALAGHETTASTIAWSMLHMILRPSLWDGVQAEAMAQGQVPMSPGELKNFPFTEAVFREALRLYPPVNVDSRRMTQEVVLHGYRIPKGTVMGIPLVLLSRDPKQYPDPDRFDPERWSGAGRRPSPIETCQFGGGPHFCLGYHVAMLEGVQYLAAMVRVCAERGRKLSLPSNTIPNGRYVPFTKPVPTRIEVSKR